MRISRFKIAVALLTVAVIPYSTQPSRAQILVKPGESIAFQGDSITQFGADRPSGYVRLVEGALADQRVPITVIPAGYSGTNSRDMLGLLDKFVLSKKPTWMALSAGVNDVMHKAVELEEYKTNVTAILDRAQQAGVKVVLLTPTPIGPEATNPANMKLAGYNAWLRETAKARNIPLADLNAAIFAEQAVYEKVGAERSLTNDGVHMNVYGNMVMAKGVLSALGFNDTQIAAAQTKWNKMPDVYPLPNGPTPRGTGTGLTGQYFSDTNFATLVKTQVDAQLYNFQWGAGSPTNVDRTRMDGMPSNNFSVRWTGQIQALEEGNYSFGITANDTAKVWIGDLNGTPLINKTAEGGAGSNDKATFFMKAGQKYNVRIDYSDITGDAEIMWTWTRPGLRWGIVPKTQLYPTLGTLAGSPIAAHTSGTKTGPWSVNFADGWHTFGWASGKDPWKGTNGTRSWSGTDTSFTGQGGWFSTKWGSAGGNWIPDISRGGPGFGSLANMVDNYNIQWRGTGDIKPNGSTYTFGLKFNLADKNGWKDYDMTTSYEAYIVTHTNKIATQKEGRFMGTVFTPGDPVGYDCYEYTTARGTPHYKQLWAFRKVNSWSGPVNVQAILKFWSDKSQTLFDVKTWFMSTGISIGAETFDTAGTLRLENIKIPDLNTLLPLPKSKV